MVGADITLPMLRLALKRRGTAPAGNIGFSLADMCLSPFKDQSADIVTGGYALRNAPDLTAFLREVHRMLRPGGVACFLDFSRSGSAPVSRLQNAVLGLWGGVFGWILHRRPEVYGYIAESLRLFPDRKRLEDLIATCGFAEITTQTYYFGLMAIVSFSKPR